MSYPLKIITGLLMWLTPAVIDAARGGKTSAVLRPQVLLLSNSPAVVPSGWRRTTYGWEQSELWARPDRFAAAADGPGSRVTIGRPQSINGWIQWGRRREIRWIGAASQWVRGIHPIVIGCSLVGIAVLIARLSEPQPSGRYQPRGSARAPAAASRNENTQ